MTTREDAVREWRKLMGGKQDAVVLRFGLTGDGSDATTADVDARPGWAWVRYDEEPNKVSQVRNRVFPGIQPDIPVVIGKRYVTDSEVQILGINFPLYDMAWNEEVFQSFLLPAHGPTHHAVYGTDPAEIDTRNVLNGRVRPTSPETLGVYVEPLAYMYNYTRATFGGGGIDLTNDVPGIANYQLYAVVTLDIVERGLRLIKGVSSPNTVPATPPTIPLWQVPLAGVVLYNGMDVIAEADIHEFRVMFEATGHRQTYRNLVQWSAYQESVMDLHLTGGS